MFEYINVYKDKVKHKRLVFVRTLHTAEGGSRGCALFIIYSATVAHARTRLPLITDRSPEGKHEILHIRTHTHARTRARTYTHARRQSQGDVFVFLRPPSPRGVCTDTQALLSQFDDYDGVILEWVTS